MKSFKQWTEENHPEDEMMQEIFASLGKQAVGALSKIGKTFSLKSAKRAASNGVDLVNRARVGMKRAGQVVDKVLGDDPYDRQKENRRKNRDQAEFIAGLSED